MTQVTTYKVKSGDCLSRIAAQHKTTVNAIRALNNIPETSSLIHPGQILKLPQPTVYIVKEGESLGIIAARHNITIEELKQANDMPADKNLIHPKQTLIIPGTAPQNSNQTITPNDKQARADSLNTEFQPDQVSSTGACPIKDKIYLFPVRYAIDESPTQKGTNQGPNPIPKDWLPTSYATKLTTRSYTLRQLRDGWVYVWDQTSQELHEYKLEGQTFTLMAVLDKDAKEKISNAKCDTPQKGQVKQYLAYPPDSHLYLSYSQKQCTDKIKKQLTKPNSKWTRELKLADYNAANTTAMPHVKAISELGKYVADIQANASPIKTADFTTTMVATVARVGANQTTDIKSIIDETTIQGSMPKMSTGLFIALDDPLGIIDDLSMNLAGRIIESDNDQYPAVVAQECLALIGSECYTDYMSDDIKNDPIKKYQCILAIDDALSEQYVQQKMVETWNLDAMGGIGYVPTPYTDTLYKQWNISVGAYGKNYESWKSRLDLRKDIKLSDIINCLIENEEQQTRYQQHIINSEDDLEIWINQLSIKIAEIFLDNTDVPQSEFLLEKSNTLYTYLATTDNGREWIVNQCETPTSLIGLASYNFSQPLHQCTSALVDEMVETFKTKQNPKPDGITDQWVQDNIINNDNMGVIRSYVSNTTNALSRTSEVLSAVDMLQQSKAFQSLSAEDKQAFETQKQVAAKPENEKMVENITAKVTESIESAPIADIEDLPNQPKPNAKPATPPKKPRGRPRVAKPVVTKAKLILRQSVIDAAQKITGKGIQLGVNQDYTWLNDTLKDFTRKLNDQIKNLQRQLKAPNLSAKEIATLEHEIYKRNLLIKRLSRARAPAFFLQWMEANNIVNETTLKLQQQIQEAMIVSETPKPSVTAAPSATKATHTPPPTTPPIKPTGPKVPGVAVATETLAAGSTGQKISQWFDSVGGKLPVIVLGANLVNLYFTIDAAQEKGLSSSGRLDILSAGAYTANAFAALYVGPYWAKNSAFLPMGQSGSKVTAFAIGHWKNAGQVEAVAIAQKLAASLAVLSALALLGSSVEFYQVYTNDYQKATSDTERNLLFGKLITLGLMSAISAIHLSGAILARFIPLAWVMNTPIGVIIAIIGVAYFIFSLWAAYEKREGIMLWLARCYWSNNVDRKNFWPNTPEGHKQEQYALYKELLQPTLYSQRTNKIVNVTQFKMGIWLAIQFPAYLSDKVVNLKALLLDKDTNQALVGGQLDSSQLLNHGSWVALPKADEKFKLPNEPMNYIPDASVSYSKEDNSRIWRTWLEFNDTTITALRNNQTIALQLAITYPNSVLDEMHIENLDTNYYIYEMEIDRTVYTNGKTPLIDYYAIDQQANQQIAVIKSNVNEQYLTIVKAIEANTSQP